MFNTAKCFKLSFFALLFICGSFWGYSQNCNSKLEVVKNRSYKSVDVNDGTTFHLNLKNESRSSSTYTIVSESLKVDCANKHYPSKGSNTSVAIEILSKDGRSLKDNKISLGSGQSVQFKVKVDRTKNTASDRWSCINLKAISDNCKTVSSSTVLRAYIPKFDSDE